MEMNPLQGIFFIITDTFSSPLSPIFKRLTLPFKKNCDMLCNLINFIDMSLLMPVKYIKALSAIKQHLLTQWVPGYYQYWCHKK